VRAGAVTPPDRVVRGSALVARDGTRAQLAAPVSAPLVGWLAPAAAESGDGRYVAYNSWTDARPVDDNRSFSKQGIAEGDALGTPFVRMHDNVRGTDFALDSGAYSPAWRADGALAYVRGTTRDYRAGHAYTGEVVVRSALHARPTVWVGAAARYVVYGWAGTHLLVYRIGEGESFDVVAVDGPGKVRDLGAGSIVAISPDGTRVATLSRDGQALRVLDVADGGEEASLDLTRTDPPLQAAVYSGDWKGDQIVMSVDGGVAVLDAGHGKLALSQLLTLDRGQFPAGIEAPRFVDDDENLIVAVADEPPTPTAAAQTALLECDRTTRACTRGDSSPARVWLRPVDNPSRPRGGSQ
jgi:hypothetical protein